MENLTQLVIIIHVVFYKQNVSNKINIKWCIILSISEIV